MLSRSASCQESSPADLNMTSENIFLKRYSEREDALAAISQSVCDQLWSALQSRNRASLGVCGGQTAAAIFPMLAQMPMDWENIHIILIDDRWVDPTSHHSNECLVREGLLRGHATAAKFTALKTRDGHAVDALRSVAACVARAPLPIDCLFISMGSDGHIASLFPGGRENLETEATVVASTATAAPTERISLGPAVLQSARYSAIAVVGQAKASMFDRAKTADDPFKFPICHLLKPDGRRRDVFLSP
ncbi:MAG: 6-phosphogluconolactonase [Gammaproteobacteria bacterium]|nr:6-phosphogluconolactonase [Gammaproteobacteria bacterium]